MVEESVDRAFDKLIIDMDVTVQSTLVTECIRILPKGKACGSDGITREHLVYLCSVISTPLAGFYTQMIRSGYIPDKIKEGEIITLHKGGRKSKSDPNKYRAITLSPSILKVYETILLHRGRDKITQSLNKMQGGFQEQLGCLITYEFCSS